MTNREGKFKASMTTKKYSLLFSYCDPVLPALELNSNRLKHLEKFFDEVKANEIKEYLASQVTGGEWDMTLYEHTPESARFKWFDDEGTLYNVTYTGSIELRSFGYSNLYDPNIQSQLTTEQGSS